MKIPAFYSVSRLLSTTPLNKDRIRKVKKTMNILIIAEDPSTVEYLELVLRPEYPELLTAKNVEEGAQAASFNPPDLVILDLETLEGHLETECRDLRQNLSVPIIALSVQSDPTTTAKILDYGADDFLTKPFYARELIARIHILTRRARPVPFFVPAVSHFQ